MCRKSLLRINITLVLLACFAVVSAHDKVVVIPMMGEEAPDHRIVFATQGAWTGDLGGPEGADEKCQAEADASGSMVQGRLFKAWLSRDLPNNFALDGRYFHRSSLPYKRVDGEQVAADYGELFAGDVNSRLDNPINLSADGIPSFIHTWTGLTSEGYRSPNDCDGWESSDSSLLGEYGYSFATGSAWIRLGDWTCAEPRGLICFEQ